MKYLFLLILLSGCTNLKITLPSGGEILYQKVFTMAKAKRAELYYEDPNTTIWIILNDPNSSVNRGKLMIIEPRTGLEVGLESE
jgi:hypothetical protein